jgi:hypothetical protein
MMDIWVAPVGEGIDNRANAIDTASSIVLIQSMVAIANADG